MTIFFFSALMIAAGAVALILALLTNRALPHPEKRQQ